MRQGYSGERFGRWPRLVKDVYPAFHYIDGVAAAHGKKPLVSVVTPVYNGDPFLAECIESVLSQTHTELEYLIVDNHSTDDTAAIAAAYARRDERVRVIRPERHLPMTENFNFTVRQAATDAIYLKTVHADDTLYHECLDRMVEIGERHPNVAAIGAMRVVGDGEIDLDGIPPDAEWVPGPWLIRRQLLGELYVTGPPTSSMFRLSAIRDREPLYDPAYQHCDDALMCVLLRDNDFGYLHEPLTTTRLHGDSETTWVSRVGSWLPEHLRMVLEFGPGILSPDEVDYAAARLERQYAKTLLKWTANAKLMRDRDAREFHRNAMRHLGRAYRSAGRPIPRRLALYARLLGAG